GEGTGDRPEHKGQRHCGSSIGRSSMTGQDENAGADDATDTERHQMQRRQRAPEWPDCLGAAFGHQIGHGFPRPDVGQSFVLFGIDRLDRTATLIRNKHCATLLPCKVARRMNFWQEVHSAALQGASPMRKKGSDLLVAALENEGVQRIFGLPGEENLAVVESLRHSKIELVLTRHEQAASFMAATQGRLTGSPGVCLSTLGPGALNFTTGAAYAYLGAMPMIIITGQKAIKTARPARFQLRGIVGPTRPITKLTRQIISADAIPSTVRDAFRVATEERPGPGHLEFPEDFASEESTAALIPRHPMDRPLASPASIRRVADMILAAKRPLVMIGAAGNRPRLVDALSDFVRRAQ